MRARRSTDPAEFQRTAAPFLLADEAMNCLGLGIVQTLIDRPAAFPKAYLWTVEDGARIVGAAWMTPPHPLGLTAMPDAALDAVLAAAAEAPEGVRAVVGPKREADRAKDLWCARTGEAVKHTMEQRIFEAARITLPYSVPGVMRVATDADRALVAEWMLAFCIDCHMECSRDEAESMATNGIGQGRRFLWVDGGEPVATASFGGPTPHGMRINAVYTPPEKRGKGYATGVVGALSQKLLDEGRQRCFLYTDLANPTSNSIYQKLGYRPVGDSVHHTFKS